jgi:hypothetical protein
MSFPHQSICIQPGGVFCAQATASVYPYKALCPPKPHLVLLQGHQKSGMDGFHKFPCLLSSGGSWFPFFCLRYFPTLWVTQTLPPPRCCLLPAPDWVASSSGPHWSLPVTYRAPDIGHFLTSLSSHPAWGSRRVETEPYSYAEPSTVVGKGQMRKASIGPHETTIVSRTQPGAVHGF